MDALEEGMAKLAEAQAAFEKAGDAELVRWTGLLITHALQHIEKAKG